MAQVGWCAPLERAGDLAAAGLDYHELQLVPLKLEDDAAFAEAKARVRDLPLPVPVASYLFPHDLRLVGPDVHEARARAYFDRVVALMDAAGAKLVVFGSGWTRNVPEGFDRTRAEAQFVHAVAWCADALAGIGGTLVVEPLNRKESNQCNTVADGVRLARASGRANASSLADFYHVDEEHEPFDALRAHGAALAHVHLADTGRLNPGSGAYDHAAFFAALKAGGYAGRFSAECGFKGEPVASMRASAAFVREAWAAA
ncbi:MAG TPA: sugar phosphate isomerase/epimerase family protein [Burkholderiaceae bacterium]|nr:sugar phosphate isomerase/epimerase family protein [Burkholderiaceae bacterium]